MAHDEQARQTTTKQTTRWQPGGVGHFGLAVSEPKRSARWWISNLGMRHEFDFDGGVAIGNDAVTIALFKGTPRPDAIDHVSFHLKSMAELRAALRDLRERGVELEDPGDEIGPEGPGSPHMGLWFHDPDGYRWELSVQNGAKEG
jgi:catechol 2,3-dioxygenase-like lactoylglutathione lyase family enzyme